jgi:hypothetical protein
MVLIFVAMNWQRPENDKKIRGAKNVCVRKHLRAVRRKSENQK